MCLTFTMARHGENENKGNEVDSTTTTPKSSRVLDRVQRRRIMKHMVEKRRRNRINDCLDKMRILVLKAQNKNPDNYTKMEKADILEMTVNFLYVLNQQKQATEHHHKGNPAVATPPSAFSQHRHVVPAHYHDDHHQARTLALASHAARDYARGFARCEAEVNHYLSQHGIASQQTAMLAHVNTASLCSPSTLVTPNARRPADSMDSFMSPSSSDCSPEFKPHSNSTPVPVVDENVNVLDTSVWRPW